MKILRLNSSHFRIHPKDTSPEATGLRHLAFEVDHIENAVSELVANKIAVEPIRVDEITEKKYTFFKDPDGIPIELYEK